MAPDTMIAELQRMWNDNKDYSKDGFLDYVCFFVDQNDTSSTGCIFDAEGYAFPIADYVIDKLVLER